MIRTTTLRHTAASVAVVLVLAAAAWLAAPRPGTAAAAPAASHLRCGAPRHANGRVSLDGISRRTKVPVAIVLTFAFKCSGGRWTQRMATYLNRGSLRAPMPKGTWYWILPLP